MNSKHGIKGTWGRSLRLILGCTLFPWAVACSPTASEERALGPFETEDKITYVNPNDIQTNPTVLQELTGEQEAAIREIHEALLEVDPSSYQSKVDDFSRDLDPDKEIAIWQEIARVYQVFETDHPQAQKASKSEVYQLLLMRSMVPTEEVLRDTPLKTLTKDEAREVLSAYKLEADPIEVVEIPPAP